MGFESLVLTKTDDLPIRHTGRVHNGKVRSVYWLDTLLSNQLRAENHYSIRPESQLGVMVISDRISAFDCNWQGEGGLTGIPGKGAYLNAISKHWFDLFFQMNIASHHILDVPHPLVWIVQKAEPIMVEGIARQYITGSMWRAYSKGIRNFCGEELPEGLKEHQRLDDLLITPTTKGVLKGIPGVPEQDDVEVSVEQIERYYYRFGFKEKEDVIEFGRLITNGFYEMSTALANVGQILVDTKFELGYVPHLFIGDTKPQMVHIDEVGTPDSSRFWDAAAYGEGRIVENSKEGFRQHLLGELDKDILLNKARFEERQALSQTYKVPMAVMMEVAATYKSMAEKITGIRLDVPARPREEILDVLAGPKYELIE